MTGQQKDKKKKILFIMSFPPPYHGANLSNQMVWESDIQKEFNCRLLDISDRRDLNNLGSFDFTNVFLAIRHLFQTVRMLFTFRPDMVYLLISQNNWAVVRDGSLILLVKIFSRAKVAIHLRGAFFKLFYDKTNRFMKLFIDFTLKKVDAAIVLGKNLRFNFEKWCRNIYVVPNGTDLLRDFDIEKKWQSKQSNEIVITFLSNFYRSKGFYEVLESIKSVAINGEGKKIKYKLAGAWGLDSVVNLTAEDIKKKSFEILEHDKTSQYADFLGVITGEDKMNLLKETDIFLLPTSYDGQPRSIIEAMAAGCAVISTPVGAIPETVVDGETGFIIEPYNSRQLADKITCLIKDEGLRKKLCTTSRKIYESRYTKEKFIGTLAETFYNIAAQ